MMTDREKAIVMAYTGCVMLAGDKLGVFYKYIEEKLGHPLYTHELSYPEVQDTVREAAREDFIALAKAPEPRLLQAADFQREDADIGGGIPCWKETRSPTRRNGWAVIVYGKWLADAGIARYWTGKPTQAQMENTPWLTEEE